MSARGRRAARGQVLIEYGLLASLLALVALVALLALGPRRHDSFTRADQAQAVNQH
jgi:Flp pilus assembly pilin Flp